MSRGLNPTVLVGGRKMWFFSSYDAAMWCAIKPPNPGTMTQSLSSSNLAICLSNSVIIRCLILFQCTKIQRINRKAKNKAIKLTGLY